MARATELTNLLASVRACTTCAADLPLGPRPILQMSARSKVLIVGQAPGRRAHESGVPFSDPSGDRLRSWLDIDTDTFYDPTAVAIVPMGFCFPGTAKSGDLPPRPECAPLWRAKLLAELKEVEITLVIGSYAQKYHLASSFGSVTEIVSAWRDHWPSVVPLPHPSPRNNRWLKENPWFETELIPVLQRRVTDVLKKPST